MSLLTLTALRWITGLRSWLVSCQELRSLGIMIHLPHAWIATALQIKMPVSGTNPQILNGPSDTWDKNVKKAI